MISDLGIGDTFNAKVAGNAVNDDILGSMEYACAVAGAKAVLIMGHTSCGAIKGAIDNVVLGNLTLLLARFKTAIDETVYEGSRTSKNSAFVDAVARTQALKSAQQVRVAVSRGVPEVTERARPNRPDQATARTGALSGAAVPAPARVSATSSSTPRWMGSDM